MILLSVADIEYNRYLWEKKTFNFILAWKMHI